MSTAVSAATGLPRRRVWIYVLLFLMSVFTPFVVPLLATIGSYDLISSNLGMTLFGIIYVALPAAYAFVPWVAFSRPAWRATFAKG